MTILLLELSLPIIAIAGIILGKAYINFKYPTPKALGRVLPKLCVVDADEILHYRKMLEENAKASRIWGAFCGGTRFESIPPISARWVRIRFAFSR